MTGAEFSEVDFDRLADYVGGALDGTPEEAVVERLVAADPAWQEAYAQLTAATAGVTMSLRSWGAEPAPMPEDVVARLDAALSSSGDSLPGSASADSVGAGADPGGAGAAPGDAGTGAAPERHLVAVPDGEERPTTARKRARRLRWAAPIGVAAAVIAFLGVGVDRFTTSGAADDSGEAPVAGAAEGLSAAIPQMVESGVDYSEQTLAATGSLPQTLASSGSSPQIMAAPGEESVRSSKALPDAGATEALDRLRVRDALLACLEVIAQENGGGPISAQTADFARYAGAPAVIVHFTAANGSWAWAVGPECGSPGSGSGKLASVRVG
ncbi:hypothetical protein [Symbioplanes lichenis]|uniref:hypothetical protein n=1 Tax=Symbioplanes lichenis TaxID=1629072 RepID=UPI002739C44B|nr:hypothetical protein [Actinoplanes lichenis]